MGKGPDLCSIYQSLAMSLFLEDFDQWCEDYKAASPQEQYPILLELISTPIPLDYVEQTDIISLLLDLQDRLVRHNLIDQTLSFTATLQQQQPELYQQKFYFFDNFLIRHALIHQQLDQIDDALARYKQEPIKSIDLLLPILDDLRFYDVSTQAVDLSRAVYNKVANSSKLMGGSEDAFGSVVIADLLGQSYKQLQQDKSVDWEAFGEEAAPFSFEDTAALRREVAQNLSGQVLLGPELAALFEEDPSAVLRQLSLRFYIKMADENQLSFVCSQSIWSAICHYLGDRDLSQHQLSHPDHFFELDSTDLDRYVGGLIGGFLSFRESMGFAVLWGIPHVYDFLWSEGIIGEPVYESAMAIVANLKALLLENWSGPLWRYSFVHRWGQPANQPENEFIEEAERFVATIDDSKPLSDELIEAPDSNAMLDTIAQTLAKNMENILGEADLGALNRLKGNATDTPTRKPPKQPKPRKSALKEARSLDKKGKGAKKKSRKGKGFQ